MKDIIVFSTKTCPYCISLKKKLKNEKISFKEIDVEESAEWYQNMLVRSGKDIVPQTWIGEDIIIGDDIDAIKYFIED